MTGLDEGRLTAYLDGELDGPDRAEVEAWLEESAAARESFDAVRRRRDLVDRGLDALDPPLPDLDRVRRTVRDRAPAPSAWIRRSRLARAALLVLLLGAAGVSAAVPGSPVRAWLAAVLTDEPAPSVPAAAPDPTTGDESDDVGVRVRPAEGRLEIDLSGVGPGREVVVRMVDGEHGAVYAPAGSFRSGSGRIDLTLDASGSGPVRVEVPRSAAAVVVRGNGRVLLEKRGERLDFPGPVARVSGDTIRFGGPGG